MRPLPLPTVDANALFNACAQATYDPALSARLLGYQPRVAAAAHSYEQAGAVPAFHTLPRCGQPPTSADTELRALYTRTMVRKNGPGRASYDLLRLGASRGICPLCGQRAVRTLDHYLPKESYPDLAMLPLNLVPACSDCNFAKGGFFPVTADEQLLHPYFDRLPNGVWLRAAVVYQGNTPVLTFRADPPAAWSADLKARIVAQFDRLGLGTLYSIEGTSEVPMIRHRLQRLLQTAGPQAVQAHLAEEARSRSAHDENSWQAATYVCLAGDQRFYHGDFGT